MDQHTGDPGERQDRTSSGQGDAAGSAGFDAFGHHDHGFGGTGGGSYGLGSGGSGAGSYDHGFGGHDLDGLDDSDGFDDPDDLDGFDAFAVGAKRPAPLVPMPPPVPLSPIVPPLAGPPTLSAGPIVPAAPLESDTSLFDSTMPLPRTPRPAAPESPPEAAPPGGGNPRVRRIVAGEYLLTVNPVDGTEVALCPPEARVTPVRRTDEERAARTAAARPVPPPGPPGPELPLLERGEERERLIRLLARGRSIRITGPSGVGRSALLEAVANGCGDLAPDGVLRLSGHRRCGADLLQDLYAMVYAGEGYRPARGELPGLLREVGAVVVLDDLEFGGAALEELLATAPECAFLMSATPDVPAPAPESMVEEVFLPGLTQGACVDLLKLAAGRRLAEDEAAWAAGLWFESEGLPLRFVQAGALLRQRDAQRDALRQSAEPPEPDWDDSVWAKGSPGAGGGGPQLPDLTGFEEPGAVGASGAGPSGAPGSASGPGSMGVLGSGPGAGGVGASGSGSGGEPLTGGAPVPSPSLPTRPPAPHVPLPSPEESAAPADLLAARLGESAREALAFAVALDGECPHASHLPALVGDTHGDAALGELTSVGLAVPVAAHFRLAAGAVQQLAVSLAVDGELSDVQAHTAALHYAWWTGHSSVAPERAAAESEAILAAMTACRDEGHASAAVLLARTVAPVFALALHWGAWERALRIGQEAARLAGEVAEEAYFHHELGVLALCSGATDRARAELEASIALRAALADRQGTIVGRRTLALVNDREAALPLEIAPVVPATETTLVLPEVAAPVIIAKPPPSHASPRPAGGTARARRNLLAAGTGILLAAGLGTIVTLGTTSDGDGSTPNQVRPIETVGQDAPETTTTAPPPEGTTAPPVITTTSPLPSSTTTSPPWTPPASTYAPILPTTPPPGGLTSPPRAPAPTTPSGGHPTNGGGHQTSSPPTHTTKPPTGSPTPTPTPTNTTPTATTTSPTPTGTTSTPTTESATVPAPASGTTPTDTPS